MRYSDVKLTEICDAIDTNLGEVLVASGDLVRSDNYDELTEGMNDPRVLQIYPESEAPVSTDSQTQRRTFGDDPVIDETILIHADFYAKQRSNLGDDMIILLNGIDVIRDELKKQNCPRPFGLNAIQNFQWRWERTIFDYGAPELRYVGARFFLTFRVY